jgi:hypothetical protein
MIWVTMYSYIVEEKRIPIHKQMVLLDISNTHGGMMKNKIYRNEIMMNMYFRVCVWIFNR